MKVSRVRTLILLLISLPLSACNANREKPHDKAPEITEKPHDKAPEITVTTVQSKTVTLTQQYVCEIRSRHHIEVRTPVEGTLATIPIRAGQTVKRDDLLFQVRPLPDKLRLDTKKEDDVVSIKAPFDGLVGRLPRPQGSLVKKSETLTDLSDLGLMRANFHVPEARYLEYKSANLEQHKDDLKIELVLANGNKFPQPGKLGAIGAEFHAGTVTFCADFPNPEHLLRPGLTGVVLISQVQNDALVIPQQATLETLDKRYVYVVNKNDVAHQREVAVQNESGDFFVVKKGVGVDVGDKIVLEGVRRIRDGDKVESEKRPPKQLAGKLK